MMRRRRGHRPYWERVRVVHKCRSCGNIGEGHYLNIPRKCRRCGARLYLLVQPCDGTSAYWMCGTRKLRPGEWRPW